MKLFTARSLALLLFLFSVSEIFAQNKDSLKFHGALVPTKKFYYHVGLGYLFSAGIGAFENRTENRDGSYSVDRFNGSFGKGFDLAFGIGAKFNRTFGIETEFGYIIGGGNNGDSQYFVQGNSSIPSYTIKQHNIYKGNTFRFNPKLVFELPFEEVNAFYAKIGYIVGTGNAKRTAEETVIFDTGQKLKGNYEWVYTGGIVSGSTMALGLRANMEKDLSFFVEISGYNLHRTFKKYTMTAAAIENKNILSTIPVAAKETVFVDQVTYTSSPQDPDKPTEVPAYRVSYSTVGFRIGFVKHF